MCDIPFNKEGAKTFKNAENYYKWAREWNNARNKLLKGGKKNGLRKNGKATR